MFSICDESTEVKTISLEHCLLSILGEMHKLSAFELVLTCTLKGVSEMTTEGMRR